MQCVFLLEGETVKIICDMDNSSNRRVTLKVKLQQKQQFFTLNKSNRRLFSQTLASVTGDPIIGPNPEVRAEYSLQIPATAACTISNCSILEVEYVIEVGRTHWWSDVTVPLSLCYCFGSFIPSVKSWPGDFYESWVLKFHVCLLLLFCISLQVSLKVSGSSEVTVLFPIILFILSVNSQAQLNSQWMS